jgi:hypothetical protein
MIVMIKTSSSREGLFKWKNRKSVFILIPAVIFTSFPAFAFISHCPLNPNLQPGMIGYAGPSPFFKPVK